MERQRRISWTEARALIHRAPLDYLIVKPHGDRDVPWEFPGGRVSDRAAPEDTLRRACQTALGIELGTLTSQPLFEYSFGSHAVTYRYYLCPVSCDEASPQGYAELRWVSVAQLRDYVFDAPSQQIVDRLLAAHNGR